MNYLLDTDICIYLMSAREPQRRERIMTHLKRLKSDEVVYLSSITVMDLIYGASKSQKSEDNLDLLERFFIDFEIAPFDLDAAVSGGILRALSEEKGKPIGPLDTLIAAHAISLGATLVTNNIREFSRVPGLNVKNWST